MAATDTTTTPVDPGWRDPATVGLTSLGVVVVVCGVTVLLALADALAGGRDRLGLVSGVGLLASTLYAALTVRRVDASVAVITPPLAYLLAVLTAGQLTLPAGKSLATREGIMVVTTMSFNAWWVLGSTALALAVVLVRRARS